MFHDGFDKVFLDACLEGVSRVRGRKSWQSCTATCDLEMMDVMSISETSAEKKRGRVPKHGKLEVGSGKSKGKQSKEKRTSKLCRNIGGSEKEQVQMPKAAWVRCIEDGRVDGWGRGLGGDG